MRHNSRIGGLQGDRRDRQLVGTAQIWMYLAGIIFGGNRGDRYAIFFVQSSSNHETARIQSVAPDAWLLGGIGSLAFAVAGLVADTNRFTAFLAIVLTVLTFVICGTQFLV